MPTVLITGATGFIGRNLLSFIKEEEVYSSQEIITLSSEEIDGYTTINHKGYCFTSDNFLSMGITQIDIVIHTGAYTPKNSGDANKANEAMSNVTTTLHLLNNLPNIPRKIIFLSTIDVYGIGKSVIDENTITEPISLYGWSKLVCEKLIEEYGKQKGFIPQILRIGHIYGPGEEKYQKVIPVSMRKIIQGEQPIIYTDGNELRSFLHVKDCIRSILCAIKLEKYIGPVNIVSQHYRSIKDIVGLIIEVSGKKIVPKYLNDITTPARNLTFRCDKMQQFLCKEQEIFRDRLQEEYVYLSKFSDLASKRDG